MSAIMNAYERLCRASLTVRKNRLSGAQVRRNLKKDHIVYNLAAGVISSVAVTLLIVPQFQRAEDRGSLSSHLQFHSLIVVL